MCGMLILDTASGAWVPAEHLDVDVRASGHKAALEERRSTVAREAACAVRVEKKLGVVLGGYVACADELGRRLGTAVAAIRLRATELATGPGRRPSRR